MKKTQHCGPSPSSGTLPATSEAAACAIHQASTCCAKPQQAPGQTSLPATPALEFSEQLQGS